MRLFRLILPCWLAGLTSLVGVASAAGTEPPIGFAKEIRPLLNKHCVGCHGGVKRAAGISFIVRESSVAATSSDPKKPIQPGNAAGSELLRRVTSTDLKVRMPPPGHGPALAPAEIESLRRWIDKGAVWEDHWAFVPPRDSAVPDTRLNWGFSPLDKFVLARIEAAGLRPAPAASRRSWLRRVTFDLIGLPPTLEDIRRFEADTGSDPYQRVVDQLLASPRFGERWASVWLDLARYADSMGFEKDPHRPIWPWRDWVIRALNANMPFDDFTIRQLAGDLIPEGELDDRLATGFQRNTQTNTEGGTDDEEFRVAAVVDRINTTFEVWQGVTFRCAQCHAHPYEAIEHDEYYRAKAFFNNTRDWDLGQEFPLLNVPLNTADFSNANRLDEKIAELWREDFAMTSQQSANSAQWTSLIPQKAESTHGTKLVVSPEGELRTQGTVAHFSTFTLEVPFADNHDIQAIRLEALPLDPGKARLTPEMGFIVSNFRAAIPGTGTNSVERPGADQKEPKPLDGEIRLLHAFGDEAQPFRESDTAIRPDKAGWGAWPRIDRPRAIVFVPQKPVKLRAGEVLKIVIYHDEGPGDAAALVMNRFRLSSSANPEWATLVQNPAFQSRREKLKALTTERNAIKATGIPVLQENEPAMQRLTSLFLRGNWMDKGNVVEPGVPQIYHTPKNDMPSDRLSFARWLVSPENPLTSRVAVNRFWEQLFGRGIVETLEDFGSSGTPPSNPALLDYLALRFQRDLRWDVKKLLRELVLSQTYRQDSIVTPEALRLDSRNLLSARGPRNRLSAEMVRDQALAASGLLSTKMYGPPVMPPQPEGIWRAAYSGEKWTTSEGEDRHRRAVYTYVRRTAGYPSYQTFDAPSRDICVTRRLRTNTPLQALVTLNDPVYVEAAVALARRMQIEGGRALGEQLRYGYELATSQIPTEGVLEELEVLHRVALEAYDPAASAKLADTAELSALALVANTLLNLDLTLVR